MKVKFFCKITCFVLAFSLAFSEAAVAKAQSPVYMCSAEEWEVLKLVNKERAHKGLNSLSVISGLQTANDIRSQELYKEFSHTRPDGTDCFTALAGVSYNTAGENIAAGYGTPEEVMEAWMNSSGHKANILGSNFTHIGIGYYHNAGGMYQNYWSQMFIGACSPATISVEGGRTKSYKYGTTVEDMNLALKVNCIHGTGYVPLTDKMCSGYNCNATGMNKIKVKYRGQSTTFNVKITGINIRKAKVLNVKNKVYNKKAQTQNPKVVLNGKTLVKNKDYTISYKNNRKKGRATMIITGKGKYSGTIKKKFKITRK